MRRRRTPRNLRQPERHEPRQLLAVDVLAPLAHQTVAVGAADAALDLSSVFDLASVSGTVVRFATNAPLAGPVVYAELFDQPGVGRVRTTPATVANFLAYVDSGRYADTIVHRSVPGFVVQAGGFAVSDDSLSLVDAVPQFAAVVNEPGNTNARGTLAMAKLGGNPDSATNQFFVNLADNSGKLDAQNGGFTTFARILGDGMTVVDAIAALPVYNFQSPFDDLPAIGLSDPSLISRDNLVTITSVSRVSELVYTAASSNSPGRACLRRSRLGGKAIGAEVGDSLGDIFNDRRVISVSHACDVPLSSAGASINHSAPSVAAWFIGPKHTALMLPSFYNPPKEIASCQLSRNRWFWGAAVFGVPRRSSNA